MGSIRLGVDTGGTFTDITVLEEDTGKVSIAKVPSRRDDHAGALIEAVGKGLEIANVDAEDVALLVHGTTIVTNAVLVNVYSLNGRQVAKVPVGTQRSGPQTVLWDGRDETGDLLAPGVYLVAVSVQSERTDDLKMSPLGIAY